MRLSLPVDAEPTFQLGTQGSHGVNVSCEIDRDTAYIPSPYDQVLEGFHKQTHCGPAMFESMELIRSSLGGRLLFAIPKSKTHDI